METKDIIEKLEKLILAHSYIYYVLDLNVITDTEFDRIAHDLKDLARKFPEEAEKTYYHKSFKEYIKDDCPSGYMFDYDEYPHIRVFADKLLGR